MAGFNPMTFGAAAGFTSQTADELGAVKGAPCTVKSIEKTGNVNTVTFEWTGKSGAKDTSTMLVEDGKDGENGKDGKDGEVDTTAVKLALEKFLKILSDSDTVSDDTPIGTIISFMGTKAPAHYLTCDGTVYKISEYKQLAEFIKEQFGSYNKFGGDGTTTFAVPDLRGEFLRGTGTNSHTNQGSGDVVGGHQDGTYHHLVRYDVNFKCFYAGRESATDNYPGPKNMDSTTSIPKFDNNYGKTENGAGLVYTSSSATGPVHYTSRPTNTSVNYCIKYEGTHYVKINTYNHYAYGGYEAYSEEERCIGSYIDGKPLYRRVIKSNMPSVTFEELAIYDMSSFGIDTLHHYESYVRYLTEVMPIGWSHKGKSESGIYVRVIDNTIYAYTGTGGYCNAPLTFVVEYTKTTDEPNSFTPDMLTGYKDFDEKINFLQDEILMADETAVAMYEELSQQSEINMAQDESLVEIYEALNM